MTDVKEADANAALIRNGYDAFASGDVQGALAAFAQDILWHIPGRGPLSRDYRGPAEVLGFFSHFMELSGGMRSCCEHHEIDDVSAGNRGVVAKGCKPAPLKRTNVATQ